MLIALSVLVTGLTLIAAGLGRQVSALRVIETMQASLHLADRLLIREILLRKQEAQGALPEPAGFRSSVRVDTALVPLDPLPELEIDRVTGEISWDLRGRSRSLRLETGMARRPATTP